MLRRGLRSLDELDEVKRNEKREIEEARNRAKSARAARDATAPTSVDPWSSLGFDPLDPVWADLGSPNGNLVVSQGSGG